MRTDLSDEAEAAMGRVGCGAVCQLRVVAGGVRVARGAREKGRGGGVGEGIVSVCGDREQEEGETWWICRSSRWD